MGEKLEAARAFGNPKVRAARFLVAKARYDGSYAPIVASPDRGDLPLRAKKYAVRLSGESD